MVDSTKYLIVGLLVLMAVIDPIVIVFLVLPKLQNPGSKPMILGVAAISSIIILGLAAAILTGAIPIGG